MRITTTLIVFWLTGFHQTEAMLAILRATYFSKYNNNADGEVLFAENIESLPKETASLYNHRTNDNSDTSKNRILKTETIFEDFNSMSLSLSMSMFMSMPLSDGPSIVPSTFKSDIPSLIPSIVPVDAVSDLPSMVPKGGPAPVPSNLETSSPVLAATTQPTLLPTPVTTSTPTQPVFIAFNPTISPKPVQLVAKVTLEKSSSETGPRGVSKVGTTFIVVGALVAAGVCAGLYLKRRRRLAIAAAARSSAAAGASTTGETASTANFSAATTVVS